MAAGIVTGEMKPAFQLPDSRQSSLDLGVGCDSLGVDGVKITLY